VILVVACNALSQLLLLDGPATTPRSLGRAVAIPWICPSRPPSGDLGSCPDWEREVGWHAVLGRGGVSDCSSERPGLVLRFGEMLAL
jgi:hypothetical protein